MLGRKVLESVPGSIRVIRKLTVSVLDGSLTLHQTRVLFLIKEGFGQSQIAETLHVTPAAVCKLMHQLSENGLVTMNPGKDRRERDLGLTKKGARLLTAVSSQVEKKLNKGLSSLTARERDELMKGMVILDRLMGELQEG